MKTDKKLILAGAVLAVIIIIIIAFVFAKKSASVTDSGRPPLAAGIDGAVANTYITAQKPTLSENDLMFGAADASLQIFVYEDYVSPYSAALGDTLEKIRAESGERLAIIVRPFIQDSPEGNEAAVAVACAGEQGKWKEMRALLFARTKNQQAGALDFGDYAKQIGLEGGRFLVCLTNPDKSGTIEQETRAAAGYGAQGTPTMFVGGEMIIGARPYDDFKDSNGDEIAGLKRVIEEKLK